MSGFLGAFAGAFADALTGNGLLTLGSVAFADWSLPEKVTTGGQQQLTVHKLPGGARVFDAMGPDPIAITWSGLLFGLDAPSVRMQLEAIRDAGDQVDLTWGDQSYVVLVSSLQFGEEHVGRRITYQVTCEVVPDVPDDQGDETGDTGTDATDTGAGDTPDTASDAQDAGQRQITRARGNSAASPTATQSTAVQSNADVMMAAVNARQSAGTEVRQLGAAP